MISGFLYYHQLISNMSGGVRLRFKGNSSGLVATLHRLNCADLSTSFLPSPL